jgi:hypothetical protein
MAKKNTNSTTYGHKTKDNKRDEYETNTNQTNRRITDFKKGSNTVRHNLYLTLWSLMAIIEVVPHS